MADSTYLTARLVAPRIATHFKRQVAAARTRHGPDLAPVPEAKTIETIIDAAFWASLRREEGVTPTISMAYAPPHPARQPLLFHAPLPLYPASLAKLAPAVERPGIHLGVWSEGGELAVWGTTRRLPAYCFVVEVVASGLLVSKDRTEPYGKFRNVAVLEGDVTKFVDERNASPTEYPPVVRS